MTSFEERQRDLFNQLNKAEKQANFVARTREQNSEVQVLDVKSKYKARKTKAELKQFRGKESIFKRPEAPISHCLKMRNFPDHLKNPKKWTFYSLEDVPVMSDSVNRQAAAICMREIDDQDLKDSKMEDDCKITFKRPKDPKFKASSAGSSLEEETRFKNSKIILPQYFVGKKEVTNKIKIKRSTQEDRGPQLRLGHLLEEDDEDDFTIPLNT